MSLILNLENLTILQKLATSIIGKYLETSITISQAIWIGKKRDKACLLKISLGSSHEKAAVLRNCTKLRDRSNPDDIRNVYITPDLTPNEQQQNKTLRSKLAEMNKEGNHYRIKNRKIVQGVVQN